MTKEKGKRDQTRNGVKVIVHVQEGGTVVEADCSCFGSPLRVHSDLYCKNNTIKPLYALAAELGVPFVFTEEWEVKNKLCDEANELWDKGDKFYEEADKVRAKGLGFTEEAELLCDRGNQLYDRASKAWNKGLEFYRDKVVKELGKKAKFNKETGEVTI